MLPPSAIIQKGVSSMTEHEKHHEPVRHTQDALYGTAPNYAAIVTAAASGRSRLNIRRIIAFGKPRTPPQRYREAPPPEKPPPPPEKPPLRPPPKDPPPKPPPMNTPGPPKPP